MKVMTGFGPIRYQRAVVPQDEAALAIVLFDYAFGVASSRPSAIELVSWFCQALPQKIIMVAKQQKERWMTLFTTTVLTRPALYAGLLLAVAMTQAHAQDDRCRQLVALNKQYRGVTLTADQKQLKVQMVAWYKENCAQNHKFRSRSRSASWSN